jgi:hypothetical protein
MRSRKEFICNRVVQEYGTSPVFPPAKHVAGNANAREVPGSNLGRDSGNP